MRFIFIILGLVCAHIAFLLADDELEHPNQHGELRTGSTGEESTAKPTEQNNPAPAPSFEDIDISWKFPKQCKITSKHKNEMAELGEF